MNAALLIYFIYFIIIDKNSLTNKNGNSDYLDIL